MGSKFSYVSITVAKGLYNRTLTAQSALPWGGGVGDPVISRHGPRYTRRPCIKAAVPLRVYNQRANGLRDIPAKHGGEDPGPDVASLMTRRPRLAEFSAANLQSAPCVSSLRQCSGLASEMAHLYPLSDLSSQCVADISNENICIGVIIIAYVGLTNI